MSKHAEFDITPEEQAENEAFLRGREVAGERYIKRHSKQARWTHGITVSCCIWLMFSGAFVFVPPLAAMVGPDVVFAFRMSHRIPVSYTHLDVYKRQVQRCSSCVTS